MHNILYKFILAPLGPFFIQNYKQKISLEWDLPWHPEWDQNGKPGWGIANTGTEPAIILAM